MIDVEGPAGRGVGHLLPVGREGRRTIAIPAAAAVGRRIRRHHGIRSGGTGAREGGGRPRRRCAATAVDAKAAPARRPAAESGRDVHPCRAVVRRWGRCRGSAGVAVVRQRWGLVDPTDRGFPLRLPGEVVGEEHPPRPRIGALDPTFLHDLCF